MKSRMETINETTNMETTKELIAHVNDIVSTLKPITDQCSFSMFFPKRLSELELEQFIELCEWREVEPKIRGNRFEVTLKIEGVNLEVSTAQVPELMVKNEPTVTSLIKSILADRKAQASAA